MLLGAFPIAKIAILGLKQITKPLTKTIISFAKNNPMFRKYFCAPAGQLTNCCEARFKMHALKLPQPKRIPRLSEKMATDLGANLISEISTVALGVYLIYYEVGRQAESDKKKNDRYENEQRVLLMQIENLHKLLDWQEREINVMLGQLKKCYKF